jgi:hypothetical protein
MPNDIDIYDGGAIQPYEPSPPIRIDTQPGFENRGALDEYQHAPAPSAPTLYLFGSPLPAGVTTEHVAQTLRDVGAHFSADMALLKYPAPLVNSALAFMSANATRAMPKVQRNHSFNLHSEAGDNLAEAFGNHLAGISGFNNLQKQSFITASLKWLANLSKYVENQQTVPTAHGGAPTSGRPDDLDDATYNALYDYNEKMRSRTEGILHDKWGDAYEANRRMVDEYLQSLSTVEKRHFDRFLNNGLHALNDPTVILGLWGQAVGINNIPRGAALAEEINMMHDAMKNNRKQWLSDERMQSRYRELIRIRDSG